MFRTAIQHPFFTKLQNCFFLYSAASITNRARNITIKGNIINGVRSCGIYAAAAEDIIVTNNKPLDEQVNLCDKNK